MAKASPVSRGRNEYPQGTLVEPPELPASKEALRSHYAQRIAVGANMPYEEAQDRCRWCLAVGRDVPETGAGARALGAFCSEPCRDGWDEYVRLVYPTPTKKEKNQ